PAQSLTPQQKKKVMVLIAGIAGVVFFVSIVLAAVGLLQPDSTNPINDQDRQTLVNDPDNLDALTNIGNRFYTSQQYDSALYYYNRVLEVDAQNSSGLFNKSLVYYQTQQYDKSISTIKKCIELYPNYGEAHAMLGDNYYVQNNYSEALRWYRKGYDKGVRSAEVLNIMGYLYEQQGNTTEAVRFYKEVLQQDSSWVDVYDKLIVLEPGQAKKYQQLAERWR
ncbi:MAG TPA: tetratricopeptide repeat protein, partial [Cyclobacteriaceae bacterium]|nr:tetratricopeptide repeat protein [Cyclobacteriaceae bacterium]